MNCMKCGRAVAEKAVFCENCLTNAEEHPVKPGTPVTLPNRRSDEKKAPAKKRPPTTEQRLSNAHVAIRWLVGISVVLALLLSITVAMLTTSVRDRDNKTNIGQNYSAVED